MARASRGYRAWASRASRMASRLAAKTEPFGSSLKRCLKRRQTSGVERACWARFSGRGLT